MVGVVANVVNSYKWFINSREGKVAGKYAFFSRLKKLQMLTIRTTFIFWTCIPDIHVDFRILE